MVFTMWPRGSPPSGSFPPQPFQSLLVGCSFYAGPTGTLQPVLTGWTDEEFSRTNSILKAEINGVQS